MTIFMYIFKFSVRVLYAIFRLFPSKENKVTFLSRQSDFPPIDFKLIEEELLKQQNGGVLKQQKKLKIVYICKRLDQGLVSVVRYILAVMKSMYHVATSKVCLLDSYWPAISVLKNTRGLKVIQIWHAMGKIKKSGYQSLDKAHGRNRKVAQIMGMHKNYDLIIAGGKAWNPFYCGSFNTSEEKLYNVGLPRIDYLLKQGDQIKKRVFTQYPQLSEKPVVLYAPTFRKSTSKKWQELIQKIDLNRFNLIVKGHPNQELVCEREGVFTCEGFTACELLTVCDYLVTDYSAIAVEAAALKRKTLYYVYDYEAYSRKNGLNIDLFSEMPGLVFKRARELVLCLEKDEYNMEALLRYRAKFLPDTIGNSTILIVNKILEYMLPEGPGIPLPAPIEEPAARAEKTAQFSNKP